MKKFLAISLALGMLLAFASCDGEEGTSSVASIATSSAAPVVSGNASIPSVVSPTVSSQPVVENSANLALTATPIDDGSDEYYADNKVPANLNDGDTNTGWQYKTNNVEEDEDNPVTEDTRNAYTTDDGETWHVAMVFEDGIYAGYTWNETVTVDECQVYFEFASRPVASTEGYVVEITTDGEKWNEVKDAEYTYATVDFEADAITFDAVEVKGIRVKMYKSSTKYSPQIREFEVYGPEADAETESETDAE